MDAVQTAFIWKKLSAVLKSKKQRIPALYFGFITIEIVSQQRIRGIPAAYQNAPKVDEG